MNFDTRGKPIVLSILGLALDEGYALLSYN
jgi:hypothetical protein